MTVPDSEVCVVNIMYLVLNNLLVQYVWVVNVDVLCLNHNGNLLDAVTLSAVAALRNGIVISYHDSLGGIWTCSD